MQASKGRPRRLGRHGPEVFPIALGGMGMSKMYGHADDEESVATLLAAIDRGVTLIDTADFYGGGHNEALIGRALAQRRDRAMLSVKFGALRDPAGRWIGFDARPASLKNYLTYSLQRLGVDHVDIYRPARLDPAVPIEETVGAIADLIGAGYVRYLGLSEVGADTIRRAHAVHPVADVQIEYSLVSRAAAEAMRPTLDELGIGMTAYGALSRGLLTGSTPGERDFRAHLPRFSGENRAHNAELVAALADFAREKRVSPAQLAIAWVVSRGETIVPVVGARTRAQLDDALGALDVALSDDELETLGRIVHPEAVLGTRYDPAQMRVLDSERGNPSLRA